MCAVSFLEFGEGRQFLCVFGKDAAHYYIKRRKGAKQGANFGACCGVLFLS